MGNRKNIKLPCRVIREGSAAGSVLKSSRPISFFGGVDPENGRIVERGHDLEGRVITGRQLVFPGGKGSTVGSYVLYRMAKLGTAPAGMVLKECDGVIAAGAVIADIPCVDRVDIDLIEDGDELQIGGEEVTVFKHSSNL